MCRASAAVTRVRPGCRGRALTLVSTVALHNGDGMSPPTHFWLRACVPVPSQRMAFASNGFMILRPRSPFKSAWDWAIIFLVVYSCILVPVQVSFHFQISGGLSILDVVIDIMFWMDLFFNLNTGFKSTSEDGVLIVSRRCVSRAVTGRVVCAANPRRAGLFWLSVFHCSLTVTVLTLVRHTCPRIL
jgi:hypothetical protein